MISDHRIFSWDYRQQPNWEDIAEAVWDLSGGEVRITVIDTASDEYAIVVSEADMTSKEAHEVWAGML